ncbi:MAG: sulfur carrier protein ThiS [Pseudomonadota bacterium]
MKITLNGEPIEVVAMTLSGLLEEQGQSGRVATAVNEVFVPANARSECRLAPGDRIEILAPMQGG